MANEPIIPIFKPYAMVYIYISLFFFSIYIQYKRKGVREEEKVWKLYSPY